MCGGSKGDAPYNSGRTRGGVVESSSFLPNKTLQEMDLDTRKEVLAIIDEVLSLGGRANDFELDTPLLGALPELDSMAVVGLINMIEERFGFVIEDDEIDGAAFASVGTLVEFVEAKLA